MEEVPAECSARATPPGEGTAAKDGEEPVSKAFVHEAVGDDVFKKEKM